MQYEIVDKMVEIEFYRSFYHSKKHKLFIRYFAENGECFPMEIRPEGLNVIDYHFTVTNQNGETKLDKISNR